MTPGERTSVMWPSLGMDGSPENQAAAKEFVAAELERAWLQGWEVARAQMVAAGLAFAECLSEQSFLSLTGPKTAVQGVQAFVDGIKGAARPEVIL